MATPRPPAWIYDDRLAYSRHEITTAYIRTNRILGSDWIDRVRESQAGRASPPALEVVAAGRLLRVLEDAGGAERLVKRLRENRLDAWAELSGAYLVTSKRPEAVVDFEPEVRVGDRTRSPDFRCRLRGTGWTYVEVTIATPSRAQMELDLEIERIGTVIDRVPQRTRQSSI